MATPTQNQPFGGPNPYPTPGTSGPPPPQSTYVESRPAPSSASSFSHAPQFDKYCVIHIATTCDEHGVYVTKDSAEVIEIGWVVVDAREPALPEVSLLLSLVRTAHQISPVHCLGDTDVRAPSLPD